MIDSFQPVVYDHKRVPVYSSLSITPFFIPFLLISFKFKDRKLLHLSVFLASFRTSLHSLWRNMMTVASWWRLGRGNAPLSPASITPLSWQVWNTHLLSYLNEGIIGKTSIVLYTIKLIIYAIPKPSPELKLINILINIFSNWGCVDAFSPLNLNLAETFLNIWIIIKTLFSVFIKQFTSSKEINT